MQSFASLSDFSTYLNVDKEAGMCFITNVYCIFNAEEQVCFGVRIEKVSKSWM